jgi:hypothetical protein
LPEQWQKDTLRTCLNTSTNVVERSKCVSLAIQQRDSIDEVEEFVALNKRIVTPKGRRNLRMPEVNFQSLRRVHFWPRQLDGENEKQLL